MIHWYCANFMHRTWYVFTIYCMISPLRLYIQILLAPFIPSACKVCSRTLAKNACMVTAIDRVHSRTARSKSLAPWLNTLSKESFNGSPRSCSDDFWEGVKGPLGPTCMENYFPIYANLSPLETSWEDASNGKLNNFLSSLSAELFVWSLPKVTC